MLGNVKEVEHVASLSDHCGVVMEVGLLDILVLQVPNMAGRQTYWKLNVSILKDDEFLDNFSDFWCWLQSFKPRYKDIT